MFTNSKETIMLLVEAGECRIVTADDDEECAVQRLVEYFGLSEISHQDEESADWVLKDGTIVSICFQDDYLIV